MQAPDFLSVHAGAVEQALAQALDDRAATVPEQLLVAMRYSLLAGGKRVRPALLLESYLACGGSRLQDAMPAAAAIECMHTYSLIHDDLPCMDNDDLRRGMPTCHRKFDEATAILAGDALQTLSFGLLANADWSADMARELSRRMALAAGCQGMVGGQMMDMLEESSAVKASDILAVERIHVHKTGALICWCTEAGAILSGAGSTMQDACSRYGKAVGLLFQIADDILDATASSQALGKSAGKDAAQHKATYVSILGLERARELAGEMCDLALEACAPMQGKGEHLRTLAKYILERGK
ncbi:MAG: polyprenyl synthetase family protein [Mariprofundaceae bacterium]